MKNLITTLIFICLLIAQIAVANDNPITPTNDSFAIEMKVDYNGKISNDATIEYRDEKVTMQTIPLTKEWKKSFTASSGFNFYFSVKGKVNNPC